MEEDIKRIMDATIEQAKQVGWAEAAVFLRDRGFFAASDAIARYINPIQERQNDNY